jgi:transketolase
MRTSQTPHTLTSPDLDQLCINTIRTLSIDAVQAANSGHESLVAEGIRSRVISIPSWEIFEEQPPSYREEVLPTKVTARIAIEQASSFGWER